MDVSEYSWNLLQKSQEAQNICEKIISIFIFSEVNGLAMQPIGKKLIEQTGAPLLVKKLTWETGLYAH